METLTPARSIDRRGTTITTFAVHDASRELETMENGDVLEIITDDFAPFRPDMSAWCESSGHRLVDTVAAANGLHFFVEKQPRVVKDTKLAMVISSDGLEELLSPLGFALGAALEGIDVHLYFQGPAVRVLAGGYKPKLKGWARPFSRFAAAGMTKTGHIPAQDKLRQLTNLGAHLYACGGSLPHFKVKLDEFVFDDISVVEYLTFMSVMEDSDIQIYI